MALPKSAASLIAFAERRPRSAQRIIRNHSLKMAKLFTDPAQLEELADASPEALEILIEKRSRTLSKLFTHPRKLLHLAKHQPDAFLKLIEKQPELGALFKDDKYANKLHYLPSRVLHHLPANFIEQLREHSDNHIVIIGMGPAGLAAGIESVKKSQLDSKITLITDRPDYTRHQIFRLDPDVNAYLEDHLLKDDYDEHVRKKSLYTVDPDDIHDQVFTGPPSEYTVVQTQRLEKMLHQELMEFADRPELEIITVPKGSKPNVDVTKHEVILEDGRHLKFKYLIGADGAKHSTANALTEQGIRIQYRDRHAEQTHSTHAIACYKISRRRFGRNKNIQDTMNTYRNHTQTPIHVSEEMQACGWPLQSAPEYRMFMIESVLYIGAEAPSTLRHEPDAINEWMQCILKDHLPKRSREKLKLLPADSCGGSIGVFDVTLQEADRVVYDLPTSEDGHKAYFIQMGDALRTTHYHTGNGVGTALLAAKAWGRFLTSDQTAIDLHNFKVRVERVMADNRARVDSYLFQRRQREERLALGFKVSANRATFFQNPNDCDCSGFSSSCSSRDDSEYSYYSYDDDSSDYDSDYESGYDYDSDSSQSERISRSSYRR